MSTAAIAGVGAVFQRGGAALAEVNSIQGPNKSRETIDVTSLDSSGGYREFIPSFRDPGELTLNMNFTRAVYDLLNADFEASTTQNYDIVFPDTGNTSLDFDGYVTGITIGIPTDDKVTMDVTIKITGVVTLTS